MKKKNIHSVGFISLGCPKALVDTEQIVNQLVCDDIKITPSFQEADLVVVNTCGFIDASVKESLDSIQEAKKKKMGELSSPVVWVQKKIRMGRH